MYREVTMLEVKEVLRLWREGVHHRAGESSKPHGGRSFIT
jgi:hypothetical protein